MRKSKEKESKPLLKIGTRIRLVDIKGKQARIGDTIKFSNTDGHISDHNKIYWDEKNLCVCISSIPFYRLMESGYIQSTKNGAGNFDFEIIEG